MESLVSHNASPLSGSFLPAALDEYICTLLGTMHLDSIFSHYPSLVAQLTEAVETELTSAYGNNSADNSRKTIQKTLFWLYQTTLVDPLAPESKNQHNAVMVTLRRMIEKTWLAYEMQNCSMPGLPLTVSPDSFSQHLQQLWINHRAAAHPIYDFLQHQASKAQLSYFFKCDSALNLLFFDLIAMALVGARQDTRSELSRNMWDESGMGSDYFTHVNLYKALLAENMIPLPDDNYVHLLGWQGLTGYNLFLLGGINREHYFKLVGALAITELLDPSQYQKLVYGSKRLGLRDQQLHYYTEHIDVDIIHANGWLQHVITPVVCHTPAAMTEIWIGANLRLNTVDKYYDHLLEEVKKIE